MEKNIFLPYNRNDLAVFDKGKCEWNRHTCAKEDRILNHMNSNGLEDVCCFGNSAQL